jgi:hypothetical protein
MPEGINKNISTENSINDIVGNEGFSKLNPELQDQIVTLIEKGKEKDGGFLGRFFGIKPINVAMHIGFVICAMLISVVIIDAIHSYFIGQSINLELLEFVFPIITLSLGYIFGKGSNS